MSEPFGKTALCLNCKVTRKLILHLQLFANGSENFLWVCPACNTRNPSRDRQFYIPSETVRQHLSAEQIEALPIITPDLYTRCARCGNRTTELHHWAPRAIFGNDECERWPKDYLCKDCHDQWHRQVTPQLVN
jgi:hypothetical protein